MRCFVAIELESGGRRLVRSELRREGALRSLVASSALLGATA